MQHDLAMRVHHRKADPLAPTSLPKKSHYSSPDDLLLARIRFIAADRSIADKDKFVLQLGAAFEHHKMTFNKLYRLLKEKHKDAVDGSSSSPPSIFGWPEV